MAASRIPAGALTDPSDIVGLAARRALRAGVVLKSFDLERPTLIARGEIVTVRFETGTLTLTARARALDDVAEGEQARFVNLQSSRTIEAVATAPGEAWLVAAASTAAVGGSR
jgi:flagella basal body P-ring formation protein FlgA